MEVAAYASLRRRGSNHDGDAHSSSHDDIHMLDEEKHDDESSLSHHLSLVPRVRSGGSEFDIASFVHTLSPDMQNEFLMNMDEEQLASLPAPTLAQALYIRNHGSSGHPLFSAHDLDDDHDIINTSSSSTSGKKDGTGKDNKHTVEYLVTHAFPPTGSPYFCLSRSNELRDRSILTIPFTSPPPRQQLPPLQQSHPLLCSSLLVPMIRSLFIHTLPSTVNCDSTSVSYGRSLLCLSTNTDYIVNDDHDMLDEIPKFKYEYSFIQ